jgi:protein-tyrosine phosphatase
LKILFVCLGNICRSPAAEGAFRDLAQQAGLPVTLDSAGTSDWHIGDAPYGPMQKVALARGYDLNQLQARQFVVADFEQFDLIIGMDQNNVDQMEKLRPLGNQTALRLFLDYASQSQQTEVPDPYYTRDFDEALDLIEAASRGLIAQLLAEEQVSSAAAPKALYRVQNAS